MWDHVEMDGYRMLADEVCNLQARLVSIAELVILFPFGVVRCLFLIAYGLCFVWCFVWGDVSHAQHMTGIVRE